MQCTYFVKDGTYHYRAPRLSGFNYSLEAIHRSLTQRFGAGNYSLAQVNAPE